MVRIITRIGKKTTVRTFAKRLDIEGVLKDGLDSVLGEDKILLEELDVRPKIIAAGEGPYRAHATVTYTPIKEVKSWHIYEPKGPKKTKSFDIIVDSEKRALPKSNRYYLKIKS